jgi:hypothetical protein
MKTQAILRKESFERICRDEFHAVGHTQISNLLGMHRTTVWRALEQDEPIGPQLMGALITVFGERAGEVIRTVPATTKRQRMDARHDADDD